MKTRKEPCHHSSFAELARCRKCFGHGFRIVPGVPDPLAIPTAFRAFDPPAGTPFKRKDSAVT